MRHASVTATSSSEGDPGRAVARVPSASLARNSFHLVMGQLTTMTLGILFSAALGRALGASDFGLYFLITSFSNFALVVVDWGQQFFGIRAVARSPERGGHLLGTGLVLRTVGTEVVCVPTGLSAWALGYDARTCWFAVAFVALSLPLFLAQNFGVVFRGHDRMGLDATVSVTNRAVGLILALTALGLGLGLGGVVVTQGLAGLAALAMAGWLYRRVGHGPLRFSRSTAWEILGGGTAIVTMTLATNVQPYIDAVLLSKLVPKEAVGWYGAAKSLMGTLLAPSLILGSAAFPRLSRAAGNVPLFHREVTIAQRPMVWLGGLAAVGTWTFASTAIRVVYGEQQFVPAAIILSASSG
jgi:O-antigen/teichoic acid export membrane protein